MLALVAWDAVAGILIHAVPAERSVAARLGDALVQIHLAERPGVPGAAEAGGPGQAALAGAPVLARVCVTVTVSSFTGRSVIPSGALAGKAEVSSRA